MSTLTGTLGIWDDTTVWRNDSVVGLADHSLYLVVYSSCKAREIAALLIAAAESLDTIHEPLDPVTVDNHPDAERS